MRMRQELQQHAGQRAAGFSCAVSGRVLLVLALAARASQPAGAQASDSTRSRGATGDSAGVIRGLVIAADEGHPVPYAAVTVFPGARTRFADSAGRFLIGGLAPGAHFLRARQIGFAPYDTTLTIDPESPTTSATLRLHRIVVKLPQITVMGRAAPSLCTITGIPDSSQDSALAAVFAAVRTNADKYRTLLEQYPFVYTLERWRVERSDDGVEHTVELDTTTYDSRARRPYRPGGLVYFETNRRGHIERHMNVPTFFDLADSTFLARHCFAYGGEDSSLGAPLIRVDFRPATSLHDPDVEGSVYLDVPQYMLRRTVFRLTSPERVIPPLVGLTVTTTFRQIMPSIVVFDEMRAEQPLVGGDNVAAVELNRLLRYQFTRGRPGAMKIR